MKSKLLTAAMCGVVHIVAIIICSTLPVQGGENVVFYFDNVYTGATGYAQTSSPINGELCSVWLDCVSAGMTVDVVIAVQTNDVDQQAYTLFSMSSANADGVYQPQVPIHTTNGIPIATNYLTGIVLNGERLRCTAYGGHTNNNKILRLKLLFK